MAALNNSRHEGFARALARGASPKQAAAETGYDYHPDRARRLAATAAVAARVAELIEAARWGGHADLATVFSELMRLAKAAGELETAAAMVAARGLLAEAIALRERASAGVGNGEGPGASVSALPPALTKEEWIAAFAPRDP